MIKQTKFSVLVPVYNVEKYLRQCIESVLNQTYQDFELILVNDGSTDSSGTICDEYAEKDDRIKVIHKKNAGHTAARFDAANASSGEYLAFLDSDDWWDLTLLEKVNSAIMNTGAEVVFFDFQYYGNHMKKPKYEGVKEYYLFKDKELKEIYKHCMLKFHNTLAYKIIKRELFDTNDKTYLSVRLGEDSIASCSIYEKMRSFLLINEKLYYYRQNPNSIMHNFKQNHFNDIVMRFERIDQFFRNVGIDYAEVEQTLLCIRLNDIILAFIRFVKSKDYNKKDLLAHLDNPVFEKVILYFANKKKLISRKQRHFYFLLRHRLILLTKVELCVNNFLKKLSRRRK